MLFTCIYHEADTHIVLHASKSTKPVIITATDTDVLVLLSHAYPQFNNAEQWLMKTILLLISTQFVTSSETACVKFYQNSIVLLVVIQPPTHLVLKNVSRLRKCVVSAKCICYMGKKTFTRLKGQTNQSYFSRQFYIQARKIKLLSLQGNNSTKIKNTKQFPIDT